VKSGKRANHISDLAETFANMRRAGLKLNLEKCVFGVTKGKILGCLISTKRIDANPDKIKAIREMEEPKMKKDPRGERMAANSWNPSSFVFPFSFLFSLGFP
jgi:hypothetical protein